MTVFYPPLRNEPRESDVMVGALWRAPASPDCAAGVIFFNNVGYLGMYGHGTIGVVATLSFMKRIDSGEQLIETPAGTVGAPVHRDRTATVHNVARYRLAASVEGSTARTSCSVPGRPTIVPPAALGPAPSGQASMPMEKSAKDRFGSKRVLSGVGLKAALRRAAAKSTPASRRPPS